MLSLVALAALVSLPASITAIPQTFNPGGPICLDPIFTGTPPNITAVNPQLHGLNLDNTNGTATLTTLGLDTRLTFDDPAHAIGAYEGSCTPTYLTIGKLVGGLSPLAWVFADTTSPATTNWRANYSEYVGIKGQSGPAEFLACPGSGGTFALFIQGPAAAPTACVTTTLHVTKDTLVPVGTTE